MTIKELETNLGVPRANIRFYEKEGLLSPKREENGYRDYSPEDFERLKKILILRKIGIPVSEIADLFDGAASLPDVLEQNLANLEKQMDELRGAMHLSEMMKESAADISSLDADRYCAIMAVEALLSVPLYFLGKKHPWIAEHRKAALYIAALILCAVLLVLDNVLG